MDGGQDDAFSVLRFTVYEDGRCAAFHREELLPVARGLRLYERLGTDAWSDRPYAVWEGNGSFDDRARRKIFTVKADSRFFSDLFDRKSLILFYCGEVLSWTIPGNAPVRRQRRRNRWKCTPVPW